MVVAHEEAMIPDKRLADAPRPFPIACFQGTWDTEMTIVASSRMALQLPLRGRAHCVVFVQHTTHPGRAALHIQLNSLKKYVYIKSAGWN